MTKASQPVTNRINQANGRLKIGKIGVKIEIKGSRLYLRGTFPPKPTSKKQHPYQQRIALGIHANVNGVKLAEQKAREVGAAIDAGTFSWEPYQKTKPIAPAPTGKTVSDWIEEFERDYFSKRSRTPASQSTFAKNYMTPFRKLKGENLDKSSLINAVLATEPDSSVRRQTVLALSALAKLAGLSVDLSVYRGNYSSGTVNPRDLPNDREIVRSRELLTDARSLWVYGMMATYGLRNHEIFHLDLSSIAKNGEIRVLDETKTNGRLVLPCYLEWVDEWGLTNPFIPKLNRAVETYKNEYLGEKITDLLGVLPFTPYNLRHAWARRTFECGWPPEMSAKLMGHSLTIHIKTYHAWIGDDPYRETFKRLASKPDRPRPPLG